jgi:hypothetical protein
VVDDEAHAHIPFVAILAQLSAEFMQTHNGRLPSNRAEVDEFKNSIVTRSRGGLNWEEAKSYYFHCCKPPSDRVGSILLSIADDMNSLCLKFKRFSMIPKAKVAQICFG